MILQSPLTDRPLHVGINNVHKERILLSDKIVNLSRKLEHDLSSTSIGMSGILDRKDVESMRTSSRLTKLYEDSATQTDGNLHPTETLDLTV